MVTFKGIIIKKLTRNPIKTNFRNFDFMVFIMIEIKKWNQKPWVQWPCIMLSSPFYRSVIQKAWTARWAWNWNFSESQNKRMLVLCKHAYLFDSIRVQRTLRADLNAPFWVPRFFEFPVFSPTHYQRLRHLKYKHPPAWIRTSSLYFWLLHSNVSIFSCSCLEINTCVRC